MINIIEQIFRQIDKSNNILIVFSSDWNGDDVSSSLALFLYLKKKNKKIEIAAADSIKKVVWSFLPNYKDISASLKNLRKFIVSLNISKASVGQIKYLKKDKVLNFLISPQDGWFTPEDVTTSASGFKYDLIISIGASELDSLGKLYDNNIEFFYKTPIINIDCQSNNEEFGQINLININSLTISEIVFNLLKTKDYATIDEDIATCLLTGVISKTKNFKNAQITPATLLMSSELINLGARREEIVNKLYRSRDFKTLKLWGKILNNLSAESNGSLIWSIVKKEDFQNSNANKDSIVDIIDELIINIPEAKMIVIIFKDPDDNVNKSIIYSAKNINNLEILREYSPEGNAKISELIFKDSLEKISRDLINDLKNKINKNIK